MAIKHQGFVLGATMVITYPFATFNFHEDSSADILLVGSVCNERKIETMVRTMLGTSYSDEIQPHLDVLHIPMEHPSPVQVRIPATAI